jgi:hypothetical protein
MSGGGIGGAFVASGHPLHTRTLAVEAFRAGDAGLRLEGVILDLRKCGFVPTGGELQTAGFIHHMQLTLELDETARIVRLATAQPVVAFEATPQTGGDSCRDPAPRLQALVGERVDAGFVRRLGAVFGGALGCSHLLTLAQWMAAGAPGLLAAPGGHAPGERAGKRVLFLDGSERPEGGIEVAIQQSEFVMRPQAEIRFPLERLARQHEVRVLARLDAGLGRIDAIDAAERERGADTLATAAWRSRADAVAPLADGPALRGLAARVLALEDAGTPLRDALLNLAPGVIQCFAALAHRIVGRLPGGLGAGGALPRELSVGGFPDSCFMWRRDGALGRTRAKAEAPEPA